MNITNNVASLQANQTFMDTTANNITQNKDLTKDLPNQIIATHVNEVNVNAIKIQDSMIGSLLDIKA